MHTQSKPGPVFEQKLCQDILHQNAHGWINIDLGVCGRNLGLRLQPLVRSLPPPLSLAAAQPCGSDRTLIGPILHHFPPSPTSLDDPRICHRAREQRPAERRPRNAGGLQPAHSSCMGRCTSPSRFYAVFGHAGGL